MKLFFKKILGFIRLPTFLAFVYFTVLSIIMTYPLIARMGTVAPGAGGGDGSYFIWLVGWYQKALFQLKISPFFAPYLNYPQGWNLATTDITPAMVAIALPGSLLFGPTWGYNFSMLLSFILSGWAMYLWVKHLTDDPIAGLVAGTVFAFLPYRMVHFLVGHLNLVGTQWFPFYFWGLFDLLKQEKFSWKPVLMAGIAAGLIGLTSPYYTYMTVLTNRGLPAGFYPVQGLQTPEVCSLLEKPAGLWRAGGCTGGPFDAAVHQPGLPERPGLAFSRLFEPLFGQSDRLCDPLHQAIPMGAMDR